MTGKIFPLKVSAALAASLYLLSAGSVAFAKEVRISGFGARKCSEWLEWKNAKNGEARALGIEWVNGFITGHNIYARSASGPANTVAAEVSALATLLDAYCEKNPESRMLPATIEITQSLGGARVGVDPKAQQPQPGRKPNAPKGPSEI